MPLQWNFTQEYMGEVAASPSSQSVAHFESGFSQCERKETKWTPRFNAALFCFVVFHSSHSFSTHPSNYHLQKRWKRKKWKSACFPPVTPYRSYACLQKGRCCLTETAIHASPVPRPASPRSASGNYSCIAFHWFSEISTLGIEIFMEMHL